MNTNTNPPDMQSPQTTLQEVYDFVVMHLLTQGSQSHDGINCCYRDTEGRTCAVGCLIPGEIYCKELEGKDYQSISHFLEWDERFDGLLTALQTIHDSPHAWREPAGLTHAGARLLHTLARECGLSAPLAIVLQDD